MSSPLTYAIEIPAPRARVLSCMLDDATYRDWTTAFCAGSYYEGEWRSGSAMRFLGPDGRGMRAHIDQAEHPAYVSIRHLGEIGADTAASDWVGAYENYRFHELADGGTRLEVELLGVPDAYAEMFNRMWPQALERLRQICVA